MAEGNPTVLEREIRIDARPEIVFGFFTDPAKIVQWLGREADFEARVGAAYRIVINDTRTLLGEFVELVPHKRIVFTWGWEDHPTVPPGSSTVEVTLEPDGDGTLLRLRHRNLPSDQERANHARAWDPALSRLTEAARAA